MSDDRHQFLADRKELIEGMEKDQDVAARNLDLLVASDKNGYSYMWDWLGVPIIQMPADIVVMQEIIWKTRPDVIVETGIARGGSAILHTSLLRLTGKPGKVIAVDIDIRAHNRETIESHPLGDGVTLIEGSSVDPVIIDKIRSLIPSDSRVMVVLDSDHTHAHVLAELELYSQFVTPGMYLIAADTFVEELPVQLHRPREWGPGDNPKTAVDSFLASVTDFKLDAHLAAKMLMSSSAAGYLQRT